MSILGRQCILGGSYNSIASLVLEKMGSLSTFSTMYKTFEDNHTLQNVRVVDFRSDTISKPTEGMRRAMYEAEVGDDVMGEDPTVNALEQKAAKMFGKEASLFVASGTMGNLIATLVHCERRSSEIIVGDKSHMLLWEQSGPAQLGGVQMTTVTNLPDGTFSLEEMMSKLRDDSNIHTTRTALICVENTHNWCGGYPVPLGWIEQLVHIARDVNIPLHMDGARVFNAALCYGISVAELCKDFASISVCLSKGLGAPVGSLLVGSRQFINKARRFRKVLGGGWRQAGVLAAAGIYALDHMVARLAEDHARARAIAEAISATSTSLISLNLDQVKSNMFFMDFPSPLLTANQFCDRLYTVTEEERREIGEEELCIIKIFTLSNTQVRVVLCCNLTDADIRTSMKKIQYVIQEFERNTSKS